MPALKDSKTEQNLKDAFAGESQANRRYLYFARKADIEGYNDVSTIFRSTAEGETGHAHGHLDYLQETGDPATGMPIGGTAVNLAASVAGETRAMRASTKSPIGLRLWPRPKNPMPAASRKRSIHFNRAAAQVVGAFENHVRESPPRCF